MSDTYKIGMAALSAAFLAFAGTAYASDTATTTATVTIAQPIAITEVQPLAFGTVSASSAAGTVVVATTGARTVTGGVTTLGGSPTAASYNVTGQGSSAYTITLPSSTTLSGPGTAMTANNFVDDAGASPTLSAGSGSFNVGATLNVNANQVAGDYSGTYTVTVSYN